jgi:hypothetical protein
MTTLSDEAARFHNRLRILMGIDRHELVEAGAIKAEDGRSWDRFATDPYRFFIRADDPTATAIWSIVEAREAKRQA